MTFTCALTERPVRVVKCIVVSPFFTPVTLPAWSMVAMFGSSIVNTPTRSPSDSE